MPAFTREDGLVIDPPAGWSWRTRPGFEEYYNDPTPGALDLTPVPTTRAGYRLALATLFAWARAFTEADPERHLMLEPSMHGFMEDGNTRIQVQYYVYLNYQMLQDHYQTRLECSCGTHDLDLWAEACPTCNREIVCTSCNGMARRFFYYDNSTDGYYCHSCTRACAYRMTPAPGGNIAYGSRCGRRFFGNDFSYCEEHGERTQCTGCERMSERPLMMEISATEIRCPRCAELTCLHCGSLSPTGTTMRYHRTLDITLCPPCDTEFQTAGLDEEFDEDDPGAATLLLENNPHRPVRTCSIELECAEPGGNALAVALYNAGLNQYDRVAGYHSSPRSTSFCHVEYDRSLGEDGGELIFNKIDLSNPDDAFRMHQAVGIVRSQIKAKKLNMNMRCGLHVHVDAHGFGLGHVRNLVLLFNYLEDPLYQMAAAKYVRHRGTRYSNKIDKGPYPDKQEFGKSFLLRNNHNHALNVSHYWQAMQQCGCGAAMIGEHERCGCTLGKCTFEFRVWNGTANIRKIAAYTAISQSLVAYARMINDLNIEDFPVCEHFPAQVLGESTYTQWYERMEWMLRNLYFSPTERANVLYVLRNSPLNRLGEERLSALAALEYEVPNGIDAQEYQSRVARDKQPTAATTTLHFGSGADIPEPIFDDYDTDYDEEPY